MPKQLKAVRLLTEGVSYHEVARQLGVSQRTIERWAVRPDIKQAVQDARVKAVEQLGTEVFERCREAITKGLPKSVARVLQALDHEDARIQLKAAELLSKWSGFYQQVTVTKSESQSNAKQTLNGYLNYLESVKNGNSNHNN